MILDQARFAARSPSRATARRLRSSSHRLCRFAVFFIAWAAPAGVGFFKPLLLGLVAKERRWCAGAAWQRQQRQEGPSIVDSTWFVSGKNLARETFSGLVQNESKAFRLISICTKHRKSFSRQILSRDKPSGIADRIQCSECGSETVKPQ